MASAHNLPTLKQLKYFIALSESLNFTLAAQACFVGQSTLSAGLK
jgi:LysR family hydrogen peroxide-inducible transcriptional activator